MRFPTQINDEELNKQAEKIVSLHEKRLGRFNWKNRTDKDFLFPTSKLIVNLAKQYKDSKEE